MSSNRRRSREAAFQALYSMSFSGCDRHQATTLLGAMEGEDDVRRPDELSSRLLMLAETKDSEIAAALDKALVGWSRERLSATDGALLRLGAGEILFCPDIPGRVTINEYIELARTFGDDESPRFVNGVLDRVLHDHPKPPAPNAPPRGQRKPQSANKPRQHKPGQHKPKAPRKNP